MTLQRLRFKLRKVRALGEELSEESGELNLVPYLDIIMNIIMFLLATVTFAASMGNINLTLPTAAPLTTLHSPEQKPPRPELNLTVSISDRGFTIATSGAVLYQGFQFVPEGLSQTTRELPTLPLNGGQYDFAALTRALGQIKDHYPDEDRAVITASPQISYELLVNTMDAMRESGGRVLFPGVLLGAGLN